MLGPESRTTPSTASRSASCSKTHTPAPGAPSGSPQSNTTPPKRITEATKKDLITGSQSNIKDREAAEKWLHDATYLIKGEPTTGPALGMALLFIANGNITTYSKLIDGMRAVAICLLEERPTESTIEIAETITENAKAAIEKVVSDAKEEIATFAENCTKSLEEAEERRKRWREERRAEEASGEREEEGGGDGEGQRGRDLDGTQATLALPATSYAAAAAKGK